MNKNKIYLYNIMDSFMKYNKKNYNNLLYFIIILIIIYIFYLFINSNIFENKESYNNYYNIENDELNYYRCPEKELGLVTKSLFDVNNIKNNNKRWNIYVPCGYNNVEQELLDIKINNNIDNNKKYIFGINGCDNIVAKNYIWENLVKCYGRSGASELMPETFILYNDNDMELFKKSFSSNNIYILKKNVQRKEGLKLTKNYNEIMDGLNDDYKVVQKYIRDLYLVNGRKVNLRIYLFIVIKDNKKYFYISNIGKCIYTKKKYNDKDLDFESNITSYHLDMSVYEQSPRYFSELIKYIDVNNGTGEGHKLFNRISELLKNISLCISNNIFQSENIKNSTTFQLFGIDVIFNNNLKPYLLEINKGPDMIPKDDEDYKMKYAIQDDMFKIIGLTPKKNNINSFHLIYNS
jgi:hypothetical protein